jgi:hypothetical protein
MQQEIFRAFRTHVSSKVQRYLEDIGIFSKPEFKEGSQWISAKFKFSGKILTFNISLHHLDYHDGISVYLDSQSGSHWLRNEVRRNSSHEVPVYTYGIPEMGAQFDRIIKDMKLHFERYLLV